MREPSSGCGRSVGWLVLVAAAALACAVDDRSTGVSEGENERGESAGGSSAEPVGAAGNGTAGASGSSAGSGSAGSGSAGTDTTGAGPAGAGGVGSGGAAGMAGASGAAGAPAAVATACREQLFANGDFDAGPTGWLETWDVRETLVAENDPQLITTGVVPESGGYLAWLGGVNNGEFGEKYLSRLSQMVTIPEGAVSLTFSGYMWIQQPELGVQPTSDWAVIEFLDPLVTEGYDDLWQIGTWNEADVTTGWVPFEFVKTTQMERFRGRTLEIMADSRPDGNGTMSMWLDSLRLEARCE